MTLRSTWLWSLLVSTLTGCADDPADATAGASETADTTEGADTTDASTTDGPDSTTADDDRDEACACVVDEPYYDPYEAPSAPMAVSCGAPLCPTVDGSCADQNDSCEVLELSDEASAALECTLTALRDRTPGIVSWTHRFGFGQYEYSGYIAILEDGRAIVREWDFEDLGGTIDDAVLGELSPPDTFDACLASTDDRERFYCLGSVLAVEASVCDTGWTFDESL